MMRSKISVSQRDAAVYPVNCVKQDDMDPLNEYGSRCDRWRAEEALLRQRFIRIGNWRLAVGILEAILACLVFGAHWIGGWFLLPPVIAFAALAVWHRRVIRRRTLAERAIRYYERGMARLGDSWAGTGNPGDSFRDASHVYADDLDAFGKGSLYELIATARTAAGERTLANWLLSPATRDEVLARQEAACELRPGLDLREELALLGEDVRSSAHADALGKWGTAEPVVFSPLLRQLAPVLVVAGCGTLIAFLAGALPLWPFAAIVGLDFAFLVSVRKRIERIVEGVETPAQDLRILSLLLKRLERESFTSGKLKDLRAMLDVRGLAASGRIRRLERWMELLDSADHLLIRVIRPLVLWREQAAMGVEAWRRETGRYISGWVKALGEFEALSSLASLAFERPKWTFPVLSESAEACFEAEALRHPLLPFAKCIPNDATLNGEVRLLIVSGSNMSGKSTLLRSVGLNAVLAWAGAPVAAKHLRISPLQPGASIRVVDSLQDNRSRFFAEITRIRQIVEFAKDRPVLFLLDELLSGTNSHDRRIGAAAIVRGLVRSGAIGLITTHDLALTNIERDLGSGARNVHFDDRIVDGRIEFDYQLRSGVAEHSNALELMRAVGLDV